MGGGLYEVGDDDALARRAQEFVGRVADFKP